VEKVQDLPIYINFQHAVANKKFCFYLRDLFKRHSMQELRPVSVGDENVCVIASGHKPPLAELASTVDIGGNSEPRIFFSSAKFTKFGANAFR
jgi:hypothetical protein